MSVVNPVLLRVSLLDFFFSRRALARTGGNSNPFLLYRRRRMRRPPRVAFQIYLEATLLLLAFIISDPSLRSGIWVFLFAFLLQRYYLFVNDPAAQARLLRRDALEGLYVTPLGPREFLLEPFLSCRFPRHFLVALFLVAGARDVVTFHSGADTTGSLLHFPSLLAIGLLGLVTSLVGHAQFVIEWRLFPGRPLLVFRRLFSWWVSLIAACFCCGLVFRMADLSLAWGALTVFGVALGGAWCVSQLALAVVSDGVDYLWKPIARRDPDWMTGRPPRDWGLLKTARVLLIPRNPFRRRRPFPGTNLTETGPPRLWRWTASFVFGIAFNFTYLASFHATLRLTSLWSGGSPRPPGSPGLFRMFFMNAYLFPLPMVACLVFFQVRRLLLARRPPTLAAVFSPWSTPVFWVCAALATFGAIVGWIGRDVPGVLSFGRLTLPFLLLNFYLLYQSHWFLILALGLCTGLFGRPERTGLGSLGLLVLKALPLGTVLSLGWGGFYVTVSGSVGAFLDRTGLGPPASSLEAFLFTQIMLAILYLSVFVLGLLAIKMRLAHLSAEHGETIGSVVPRPGTIPAETSR